MKKCFALLVGLSVLSPFLQAADPVALTAQAATAPAEAKPAVKADAQATHFLEALQAKLDHVARRANQPSNTGSSVAGLRGSKQEPMSKQLYWKGKTAENPVTIEEVRLFRTAIEEARAGQIENAQKTLRSFLEVYPKSSLKPDVEETIQVLTAKPQ